MTPKEEAQERAEAVNDPFVKYILEFFDGKIIELKKEEDDVNDDQS